jgi:dihydrofolate synthase/folylpolyglutamate synthase
MLSNYSETLEWLFSKLPMFQRIGSSAYKKDLGNIMALTQHLANPQNQYPAIHIAGTNGKGSCSHMLASVLQEAGYKVGLTTSPHLKDFRERIRVNGEICSEKFVVDFVNGNRKFIENLNASFFEVSIAMAFDYFARENVDIAVIETGMGGRLDSTNIIHPVLSVITNIGLDHTQFLGNTLAEIAFEKAGIIKENIPVVIGETTKETKPVFLKKAKETHSEILFAEEKIFPEYESDLKGFYQRKNRKTVLTAIEVLRKKGFEIDENSIQKGLLNIKGNTGLRGRWEILGENPLMITDTAHNAGGIQEIVNQIKQTPHENLHLVLGFVNDKDVLSILNLFPKKAMYYFTAPDVPRKLAVEELKKLIPRDLNAGYYPSISEAVKAAENKAGLNDLVYIGGSSFVVAEVLE